MVLTYIVWTKWSPLYLFDYLLAWPGLVFVLADGYHSQALSISSLIIKLSACTSSGESWTPPNFPLVSLNSYGCY